MDCSLRLRFPGFGFGGHSVQKGGKRRGCFRSNAERFDGPPLEGGCTDACDRRINHARSKRAHCPSADFVNQIAEIRRIQQIQSFKSICDLCCP